MSLERRPRSWGRIEALFGLGKWLVLSALAAGMAGTASAAFLIALDWATNWRESHRWIIACLPLGGFLVGWIYQRYGRSVEAGNNLIIDEIHDPKKIVPLRMTPLVLLGTVASHLFGASAGREGTAVQMGGSLADQLTLVFRLKEEDRRVLLMAGISAGFASVFGTPLAGAVFGLEVLAIGRLRYDALLPCFVAAVLADQVTLAWGVQHGSYPTLAVPGFSALGFASAIAAGAAFGIVGNLFARSTHGIAALFKKRVPYAPLRPLIGGAVVALAVWALGSTRYVGLGLPLIEGSFRGEARPWDFAAKFLFTVITLGSGFKGGEVTPLFFIGATLGAALSPLLGLPVPLCAGMGFVAVFAGAANTPLASTLMAVELFGPGCGIYAGLACVASYLFSGHAGIYHAQRVGHSKQPRLEALGRPADPPVVDLPPGDGASTAGRRILRLYFRSDAEVPAGSPLNLASSLGTRLAERAKAVGIERVVLYRVADISDAPDLVPTHCAEMVGSEEKLRAFLRENEPLLKGMRLRFDRVDEAS